MGRVTHLKPLLFGVQFDLPSNQVRHLFSILPVHCQKPKAKSQKPNAHEGTAAAKPKAKSQKPNAKSQKPKARRQKPKAKS